MNIYNPKEELFEPWEKEEEEKYYENELIFDMFIDDHEIIFDISNEYWKEYYGEIIGKYIDKYKEYQKPAGTFLKNCAIDYLKEKEKQRKPTKEIPIHTYNNVIRDLNYIAKKEGFEPNKLHILLQRICTMHVITLQNKILQQ